MRSKSRWRINNMKRIKSIKSICKVTFFIQIQRNHKSQILTMTKCKRPQMLKILTKPTIPSKSLQEMLLMKILVRKLTMRKYLLNLIHSYKLMPNNNFLTIIKNKTSNLKRLLTKIHMVESNWKQLK